MVGRVRSLSIVIDAHRYLRLGVTDTSLAVLAERHGTRVLLTLDERHFRAVRDPGGQVFRLLPTDV